MFACPRYLLLFSESGRFVEADDLDQYVPTTVQDPNEAMQWIVRDDAIKTFDLLCEQYYKMGLKPPKIQLIYADLSGKRPVDLMRDDIIDTELLMPAGVR